MMLVILLAVIGADQVTKTLAAYLGWTSLNQGISFGFFSSWPSSVLSLVLFTLIVASWALYRSIWQQVPMAAGFFLGGAISNMIDRLYWSGVRDWLPIPGTTIHNNLADYAIGLGLLLLLGHYFVKGDGRHVVVSPTQDVSTSEPEKESS